MERGAKHRELVELRNRLRTLEQELGAVVEDDPDRGTTEPRTVIAHEQLLAHAERIAQVGSWAWHVASNSVHWSDEMYRIFGVAPTPGTDLTAMFFARIHGRSARRAAYAAQLGGVPSSPFVPERGRAKRARSRGTRVDPLLRSWPKPAAGGSCRADGGLLRWPCACWPKAA